MICTHLFGRDVVPKYLLATNLLVDARRDFLILSKNTFCENRSRHTHPVAPTPLPTSKKPGGGFRFRFPDRLESLKPGRQLLFFDKPTSQSEMERLCRLSSTFMFDGRRSSFQSTHSWSLYEIRYTNRPFVQHHFSAAGQARCVVHLPRPACTGSPVPKGTRCAGSSWR